MPSVNAIRKGIIYKILKPFLFASFKNDGRLPAIIPKNKYITLFSNLKKRGFIIKPKIIIPITAPIPSGKRKLKLFL